VGREVCVVRSSIRCEDQPCSWVCREGRERKRERDLQAKSANEMRLPTFRGDGFEDPDQHWFLCEAVWSIKNVTDESIKRAQFSTTLRDRALRWYMKFIQGVVQLEPLNEIKTALIVKFKKPKSKSQCITELKEIKQKVDEPVLEFD
jgi:hypothetical protein